MSLDSLAKKVKNLKTLPTVFYQINDLLNNPLCTSGDIGEVISRDQVLSAKLLRLVNSSFFGFSSGINSITRAVTIVGFSGIRDLVLSTSITDVFLKNVNNDGFNRQLLWKHSLGCGMISKILGKYLNKGEAEELFVAGLLHDIGKVVVDQYLNEEFVKILLKTGSQYVSMKDAEKEVLGYDHCDAGKIVGEKWGLSPPIVEVLLYHHNPQSLQEFPRQTAVVHVANSIVQAMELGNSGNQFVPLIQPRVWEFLGLELSSIEAIAREAQMKFTEIEKILSAVK